MLRGFFKIRVTTFGFILKNLLKLLLILKFTYNKNVKRELVKRQ